jgi:hypothetical protein
VNAENTRSKAQKDKWPATPEPAGQSGNGEGHKQEALNALVGKQVLHALGEPRDLLKVQVRPLWNGNYRVNIYVGANAACATMPFSYFVVADGEGGILDSSPKIHRQC